MRLSALITALVPAITLAAAPANDLCAGAEVIPTTLPVKTALISDITDATTTGDPGTPSCQATVSRSVWYAFTPAATGIYKIATCADQGTGTTVDDTVLAVYTSTAGCLGPFTQVAGACDDDSCGQETLQSTLSLQLTSGTTYYVVVWKFQTTAPTPGNTALQLAVSQVFPPANDTCGGAVPLAMNRVTTGTSEGALDDLQLQDAGFACFGGVGQSPVNLLGHDVVYSFTAPAAGNYAFQLRSLEGPDNPVLALSSTCPAGAGAQPLNACLSAANRNSSTSSGTFASSGEATTCVNLGSGAQLFAVVDAAGAGTSGGRHELEVSACFPETEPNGTVAQANALACPVTGSVATNGDVDFYNLGTTVGRAFAMVDGLSANLGDFDLRITSATDTLEYDDSNLDSQYGGSAPVIAGTPVTGQAYVRVNHFSATSASEPYRLYAVVQPGSPGPVSEIEPNNTIGTASGGQRTYFTGTLTAADAGVASSDVDVFSVPATVGDLLFVALDGDPLRNGSPANLRLELLDPSGAVLVDVDDSTSSSSTASGAGSLTANAPNSPAEGLVFRARTTGLHFVRVRGGSSATLGNADYLLSITKDCAPIVLGPGPTVTQVAPATGPIDGGTAVVITGTNFDPAAQVLFGGVPATGVSGTATSLNATSPAGAVPGVVPLSVRNPDGQQGSAPGGFTYVAAAPIVSGFTPTQGLTDGGTAVAVTGSNFYPGAVVRFGGTVATGVNVGGPGNLTCVTPAHAAGAVSVTVTNPDGQVGTSGGNYTYLAPPPLVSTVAPTSGPTAGGTTVTFTGFNFASGAAVTFDGLPATGVNVTSATSLTAVSPAHDAGIVTVAVQNLDGQSGAKPSAFTYVPPPPPTVTQVAPAMGSALGGTNVTITGTNFQANALVTFGGAVAMNVVVGSATSITATTPAHAAGQVGVTVTNPDGQTATRANGFTYVAPPAPTISSISPTSGSTSGSTAVTINGTNFASGIAVTFGGVPATQVAVVSPVKVTCMTPAHTAGMVDLKVTNVDQQAATLLNGYTYVAPPAPALTDVSPSSGPENVATTVTLTGTNFENGAVVTFKGVAATNVNVMSVTKIVCDVPALAAGAVDVAVRNPDNQNTVLLNGYTYTKVENDAGMGGGAGGGAGGGDGGGIGGGGGGLGGGSGGGNGLMDKDAGMMMADAGTGTPPKKSGCGCAAFDAGQLGVLSLALLAFRGRRRRQG